MLVTLLMVAALGAAAPEPLPAFLTGCWEQRDGARWSQECWTDPRAGQMMGSSRSGTGDRLDTWEWMRIERGPDGSLLFLASPKGAPPHPFKLLSVTDRSVEFVDPAHDYPQRIHYERKGDDLAAEISLRNGERPMRWRYRLSGAPKP